MNATAAQPPATSPTTGDAASPMMLVRLAVPELIGASLGFPRQNYVATKLLAASLAALLELPPASVGGFGELHQATLVILCGAVPPARVTAAALRLLSGATLDGCAVITLFDLREGFFREIHRSPGFHQIGLETLDTLRATIAQSSLENDKQQSLALAFVQAIATFQALNPSARPAPPQP